MSCMYTCCYRNDFVAHTSTASVHIQPTSVSSSSGQQFLIHLSVTVGINRKRAKAYSHCQLKCELQITAFYSGTVCFTSLVLCLFVVTAALWTIVHVCEHVFISCMNCNWCRYIIACSSCSTVSVCCWCLAIGLNCTHQRCSSLEPQLGKGVRLNEIQTRYTFYIFLLHSGLSCVCMY